MNTAIIIFHCLFSLVSSSPNARNNSSPLILILTDGFDWKLFDDQTVKIPNLRSLAQNGAHAKYMKNSFPTSTWPNMQTIMTGLYPESHGIVSNRFWDPVYNEKFVFDYDCTNYELKFWNSSKPIWLELQENGRRSGLYFWAGFKSYKPDLPNFYEDVFCKEKCDIPGKKGHCMANWSEPFVFRIDKIMTWFEDVNPPDFVALYIDEPDWKGHEYGPNSQEYKNTVELVDSSIGHLLERLKSTKLYDQTNIIVVSDHGFAERRKEDVIFLEDYVDSKDFTLVEMAPYAHIWPNTGKLDELYNNLKGKHPNMQVYKKEDLPEDLNWKNNRRIPPLCVLVDEGWRILPGAKANYTSSEITGGHGYRLSYKNMWAIFLAHGPRFKKGYKVKTIHNVDMYPLMSHLLGIEPHPHNGSFDRVKCMLADSNCPISGQGTSELSFKVLLIVLFFSVSFYQLL